MKMKSENFCVKIAGVLRFTFRFTFYVLRFTFVRFVVGTFSVVYDPFPLSWEFVVERCRTA
jgi:hypothetical protein